jgi:glucosyl-3-phosphoglycerate synthase
MKARKKRTPKKVKAARARKPLITVVIPVLNESVTVSKVVKFALKHNRVAEVLVIDDGSIDGTPELAERAGARVITSSLLGKGASMEEGADAARTEIVLYLDGDLGRLRKDLISRMTRPLITDRADFVKATFARRAGRVTVLTARPLLRTYFPELADFSQPLGGIIAARRSLLKKLRFENDYGVDVGLLIDAAAARARIVEVSVGFIEHRSQKLEFLGEMAVQVARTILERAAEWGRLRVTYLREAKERDRIRRADLRHALSNIKRGEKLALFDMDGTLLKGRFVLELARQTGKLDDLKPLLGNMALHPVLRSRRIAALFAKIPRSTLDRVAREMPLTAGAVETVVGLRKAGYVVGVVTDSYRMAAETVRRRVFADFSISHVMRFRGEKCTGRLTIAPAMRHPKGCTEHSICKLNVFKHLIDELGIPEKRVLAVGDSENDICLLRAAGTSVAFEPKSDEVANAAQFVIENDLREILRIIGEPTSNKPEIRTIATVEGSDSN